MRISEATGLQYERDLRRFTENTARHLQKVATMADTAQMWEELRKTASTMLAACPAGEPAERKQA